MNNNTRSARDGHSTNGNKRPPLDYDTLARVLYQSIYLLKHLGTKTARCDEQQVWLHGNAISRLPGIGFPRYIINLNGLRENSSTSDNTKCSTISGQLQSMGSKMNINLSTSSPNRRNSKDWLIEQISSNWFVQFVEINLESKEFYPLDRFTILIAIWLVASECGHKIGEYLLSELVDQTHHQESNSCKLDELMQLTQVGSFWLSHKKRFTVTFKHPISRQSIALDENDDEEEKEEEEEDAHAISSDELSGANSDDSLSKSDKPQSKRPQSSYSPVDLRAKLRAIMDQELLFGVECFICGHQPSGDPFEPLKSQCRKCFVSLLTGSMHCSISYEPFHLIPLASLFSLSQLKGINRLLVLTPNELVKWLIRLKGALGPVSSAHRRPSSGGATKQSVVAHREPVERLDITEHFERLTMIRAPAAIEQESEFEEERDNNTPPLDDDDDDGLSQCLMLVERFMVARAKNGRRTESSLLSSSRQWTSESAQIIRFAMGQLDIASSSSSSSLANDMLAVCLADLLVCDSLDDGDHNQSSIITDVRLIVGGYRGGERRLLWACRARSPLSQLMLGCGRLFSSFQLIRATGQRADQHSGQSFAFGAHRPIVSAPAIVICPHCKCQLIEVRATIG